MPVPEPQTVIISCPHCATRYQVAYGTIGSRGRTVQCAHCQKSWHAEASPPEPLRRPVARVAVEVEDQGVHFGEIAEKVMDEKFAEEERKSLARRAAAKQAELDEAAARAAEKLAAEERAAAERRDGAKPEEGHEPTGGPDDTKAAIAPKSDAAAQKLDSAKHKQQQRAFWRRQASASEQLPIARLRRTARTASLVALVAVAGGGILFRVPIVEQFPQLAAVYSAVGLGVNVVGLAFRDVHTVKALQQGAEVLVVDATIYSVTNQQVDVPPVVVTLLGPKGETVYEWSVTTKAAELEPGESVSFETQVTAPPGGADRVNLSFATSGAVAPYVKAASPLPRKDSLPASEPEAGKS